ncbi:glycine cleavage system protein R [Microbulbifer sp. 2205BS26-8]|uniref:glycine cleavage system protein R n=1 Tax=Microbulbifer sp. 2205BS26-8 TaxID=3064386 RepID=UPI00273FBE6D|nr:ACT domain-containing protein [Microbulbifer sp. 2205BS26-8]MDP5210050.1 ACT domain-containing protein [Microbulbifer sp. 2205BS26-8]
MQHHLVISMICDDRPGVVETLSAVIADNGGNWEDSHMAHFAGKFAGILRVAIPIEKSRCLRNALADLAQEGYNLVIEDAVAVTAPSRQTLTLKLVGNDRPGIVREISRALTARHINMEQLETTYSSTPWSGEPLFCAECKISVTKEPDFDGLRDELDQIAIELGVEIDCEEIATAR